MLARFSDPSGVCFSVTGSGKMEYKLLDRRYGSIQCWVPLFAVAFDFRSHSYLVGQVWVCGSVA